ncbi:MAG: putative DNA binding domain-containing protein [Candidatus Saganbacteria bacterium]|nr:putative DNA binding domain-containing protein [Candidatus Saganbacteria bacterium]
MTTWEEIVELLEQGEGQSVEFEKNIPSDDDIARELVAFSNSDGGRLILGIDDKNKHLIGIDPDDNFSNWIANVGNVRCVPKINPGVEIFNRGTQKIAIITIHEGDEKPYKTDDICYIRDGSLSRPAKEREEQEITSPWSGHGLNKRQKRILDYVTEHSTISNKEYREMFNISHKTAHLELTMLADKKILVCQGAGRSTRYILPASNE